MREGAASKESTMDSRRRRPSDRNSREVDDYDVDYGRHGKQGQGRSRHDSDRSRHKRKGKRDTWSDYDSDYEERRTRRGRKNKHRAPTNIDDFDEDDFSDTTESYSSDYSDSESSGGESDDSIRHRRRSRRNKLRSSASVSELASTAWALSGEDEKINIDQQIKMQQAEIKKQLTTLKQLQSETGVKVLPSKQQTILQQDLQKLEQLQTKLRYKQGSQSLQMQLLGQQMLLCEHLKEAQKLVTAKPSLLQSPSGQSLRLQMLQQQQQALAEQQHRLLMEADQQRQMMLAAEQQRQMQLAQFASMQGAQFMSPQSFGYGGMPQQMYSPYGGTVGYF